jgi:hypothetical protein
MQDGIPRRLYAQRRRNLLQEQSFDNSISWLSHLACNTTKPSGMPVGEKSIEPSIVF